MPSIATNTADIRYKRTENALVLWGIDHGADFDAHNRLRACDDGEAVDRVTLSLDRGWEDPDRADEFTSRKTTAVVIQLRLGDFFFESQQGGPGIDGVNGSAGYTIDLPAKFIDKVGASQDDVGDKTIGGIAGRIDLSFSRSPPRVETSSGGWIGDVDLNTPSHREDHIFISR